ncbi:hypothetical protein [Rhizobium sp. BK176]|uniref:hypothetical protein n=1 Tax=Rhizobium sp. BK176 TaxID=2587071 RepID=UPI002169203F|nr:hypothetical protein [Rhizobium sp. BK176]MCS4089606.1 hypothetical protein [Rhizobium sp. BK176]
MSADTSRADETQSLKRLRLDILQEAREQGVVDMIFRSDREVTDIPLDCYAVYLWISGARLDEEAAWRTDDLETLLDLDLIRSIDRSAVVVRGPTLLPWEGVVIATTDHDAHEQIAAAIGEIIVEHARCYVVPESTVQPITASFLRDYWTALHSYLEFRKATLDLMVQVEAARPLANAAKHIEAAHAAGVKISPQVIAEAKTWSATNLGLKKAATRLSDDRDAAYTRAGSMARAALRRICDPPRRQFTATAAGPKPGL